jgi:hypothetical protein
MEVPPAGGGSAVAGTTTGAGADASDRANTDVSAAGGSGKHTGEEEDEAPATDGDPATLIDLSEIIDMSKTGLCGGVSSGLQGSYWGPIVDGQSMSSA